MMRFFLFLFCFTIASTSFAHEYYFAFAEMSYNDISQKLEITITASTHEIEHSLKVEMEKSIELETCNKEENHLLLEKYFKKHFKIKTNKITDIQLVGFEVLLNGVTNFYFESKKIELTKEFNITFDLLMKEFKEQQNKITFYYRGKTYTKPFLFDRRTQTIQLETN